MRKNVLAALWVLAVLGVSHGLCAAAEATWETVWSPNNAQSVAYYQGTVWVGSSGGLVQWDAPSGIVQVHVAPEGFPDNSVAAVAIDAEGRPWVGLGTWNGGLAALVDGAWIVWGSADGLASTWVTCLAIDGAGRKWIGTKYGVTALDDGGTPADRSDDRTVTFETSDGLIAQSVNAICVDKAGRVWIATGSGVSVLDPGSVLLDKADDTWGRFTAATGLLADTAYGVAADQAGRIWIGTREGVSVLDSGGTPSDASDDVVARFGVDQGFPSKADCVAIAFDRGTAWVSTLKGLIAFEGASTPFDPSDDRVTLFTAADGLLKSSVRAAVPDGAGSIWCAVPGGGLSQLDPKGTPSEKSDDAWSSHVVETWLSSPDVSALLAEGEVTWVGASSALVAVSGEQTMKRPISTPLAIARDALGVLWVGTTGGLVALSDGGTPFDAADDDITYFSTEDGLAVSYVRGVSVDVAGRVWCATSGGISVLDPSGTPHNKADDRWKSFKKADGLAGDRANAIAAEGSRRVWVVHESDSVSCLDHNGTPFDSSDDVWAIFRETSPIGVGSGYSVVVDPAGVKWFGLCPGLFAFDDAGTLLDPSDDRWQRFDIGDCDPGLTIDEQGRKWVATGWSGIVVLDDGGTPFDASDDGVESYTTADGLVDNRAQAIAVAGGIVWIGTDGGLSRLVP